jgi:uncharacterized protein
MATNKQNKIKTGRLIWAILLLIVVVAYLANRAVVSRNERQTLTAPAAAPEPAFVAEGDLHFISAAGDTLRSITIEIADNSQDRVQGLMYRSALDDTQGMLFIFDREEEQSFWMKNTRIPLDILYVNRSLEIVSLYRQTQPYSTSPIPSFKPALYVVEVRGGFCDQYGIAEGGRIAYTRY